MAKKNEFNYFDGFKNLGNYALQCAEMLDHTLRIYNGINMAEKIQEIHNIEHAADITKHDMMNCLLKEFLPPIDREDIMSLSQKIDTVTDNVEDVLIHLDIFNVKVLRPEITKFSELLITCIKCMNEALVEFKHFRKSTKLHELLIELNRLEEDGDELYTNAVRKLYKTSNDPVELMIWTDILARLERCFDACEDVADDIETTVMKNS